MRPESRPRRIFGWLLLEGLLVVVLVACSSSGGTGRSSWSFSAGGAGGAGGAAGAPGEPGAPGQAGSPGQPGQPGQPGSSGAVTIVSCSGSTCTVTLSGDATVHVLDTTIAFDGIGDRRAGLLVDGERVSCAQGETVAAGPLTIRCTSVTDDAVTFDASPG